MTYLTSRIWQNPNVLHEKYEIEIMLMSYDSDK